MNQGEGVWEFQPQVPTQVLAEGPCQSPFACQVLVCHSIWSEGAEGFQESLSLCVARCYARLMRDKPVGSHTLQRLVKEPEVLHSILDVGLLQHSVINFLFTVNSHKIRRMHNLFLFLAILGDITQKGYEKKRAKLLSPYSPQTQGMG